MARVTVKYLHGEEITGEVMLFNVNKPTFPLQVEGPGGIPETRAVRVDAVKMILFLKKEEPGGSRVRTETIDQSIYAGTLAFRLIVEFRDGEVIHGSTLKYSPNDPGFFLIPLNPADRSDRIYVNAQSVKHVVSKRLLGKILVDQNKITHEQLNESLRYQRETREKKLGAILREKEIISEQQLQESLDKQKEKNKMLGEILLEAGYITDEQLDYALRMQQENRKKKLGQVLVDLKYISPNDICIALATQFKHPWIDLSRISIPQEIATSMPEAVVKKFEVIPVEKKGADILVVATSQPQDADLKAVLSKITSLNVELVIAFEGYIESAIHTFFPEKDSISSR